MRPQEINLPKNNAIKTSILSPILGTLNISHEYKLSTSWSIQHGLSYTSLVTQIGEQKKTGFNGWQYCVDFRKYRNTKVNWNGWYHQYFLRYAQYSNYTYRQDLITLNKPIQLKENMHGINIGFGIGYQKVFKNKFVIDAFVGPYISIPTYYKSNLSSEEIEKNELNSLEENPLTSTASLRLGLKVGYLF
jgi:hypothetical protein